MAIDEGKTMEKSKLMIVVPYSDRAYLFKREAKTNKHLYIARLDELDVISRELQLPKNEALKLMLELVTERLQRTRKRNVKELMELILFDPSLYFNL